MAKFSPQEAKELYIGLKDKCEQEKETDQQEQTKTKTEKQKKVGDALIRRNPPRRPPEKLRWVEKGMENSEMLDQIFGVGMF